MKLDENDIKAIANNRYMRRVGNKLLLLMAVMIVCGFGGAIFVQESALKWALCLVAGGCAIFVAFAMDKAQKKERARLFKEWDEENRSKAQSAQ